MTPVGDIELEIVFQVAVRGRSGDLARLVEAVNKAHAVVMWFVENADRVGRTRSQRCHNRCGS